MGYGQMGDRRPFRFLATSVSGQSNQRRQDHWERSAADEESGQYLSQDGGQHATEKQHLSGSAVPPIQNQARVSHRDQGHGGQAGPIGVPHAAPRDEIRGPRSEVLRDPTPQPTDQTAQVESCQAGISSPPSSRSVTRESFWGAKSRFPDLLETLVVRRKGWSGWSRGLCAQGRRATRLRYAPTCETLILAYFLDFPTHQSRTCLDHPRRTAPLWRSVAHPRH